MNLTEERISLGYGKQRFVGPSLGYGKRMICCPLRHFLLLWLSALQSGYGLGFICYLNWILFTYTHLLGCLEAYLLVLMANY